jgi:hypothetical protein
MMPLRPPVEEWGFQRAVAIHPIRFRLALSPAWGQVKESAAKSNDLDRHGGKIVFKAHGKHSWPVRSNQIFVLMPAPNPSLVFLITAAIGASKPPESPIVAPSVQPIDASIMNPTFFSSIFGAAWIERRGL